MTEALVRTHQASVWRYLRFLGCPSATADDLTQETFLRLLRSPPDDLGTSATAAWLRGIARNLTRERLRELRSGLECLEPEDLEQAYLRYARSDNSASYHEALRLCLTTLGAKEQLAIALRYEQGLSRSTIAEQIGISEEGTKTLLRRAKDKLRLCIQGRTSDE